jgi:hypothetical protein
MMKPKKRVDEFADLRVVSVEYDDQAPDRYDSGTYIGFVAIKLPERMKVVFIHEGGDTEFAWLHVHHGDYWIDKTYAAIVTVEEATPSQRNALLQRVTPERLRQLIRYEKPNSDCGQVAIPH